jgi:hypothetical protein
MSDQAIVRGFDLSEIDGATFDDPEGGTYVNTDYTLLTPGETTVKDADGNIAISWSPTADGLSGVYSSEDLENLFLLESGETGRVRWSTNDFENYENKNFTFKVSSSLKMNKPAPRSSNNVYDAYMDAINETSNAMREAQEEAARMMKEAQRQAGYDFDDDDW